MTARQEVTPAATYVAIDIAKRTHAVLIETSDGKQRRFRMASTHEDHQRLVDLLRTCPAPVRVAMEATGDYHRTLAYRLLREGLEVCLVSSMAAARYREAVFNSWDKNDPKDAGVILALLKQGITQRFVDPLMAGHHGLQELSKTHYQISLARTRLQHSLLTHYCRCTFPKSSVTSAPRKRHGSRNSCCASRPPRRSACCRSRPSSARPGASWAGRSTNGHGSGNCMTLPAPA